VQSLKAFWVIIKQLKLASKQNILGSFELRHWHFKLMVTIWLVSLAIADVTVVERRLYFIFVMTGFVSPHKSNLLSYRKACLQVQEYNSIKIWLFDKTFSWLYNRPNIKTDSIWLFQGKFTSVHEKYYNTLSCGY
jgi:hypothetical protein